MPSRGVEAGTYQLQYWNGVDWEVGHPNHRSMTWAKWLEIRSQVRGWSTPWRLIRHAVAEASKKGRRSK